MSPPRRPTQRKSKAHPRAIIPNLPSAKLPDTLAALIGGRDDADLLVRLRRKDPESIGLLYDRYGKAAYNLAFRILGAPAPAESIVAEAILKCWNRVASFRESRCGALGVWLLATTYTHALEYKQGSEAQLLDRGAIFQDWSKSLDVDRIEDVYLDLRKLTADEKQILELAFFEGFGPAELTSGLVRPRAEVDQIIQSALSKLAFFEPD